MEIDASERVKSWVVKLYEHLRDNEADEARNVYDTLISDYTIMFTPWPCVDDVAPLVDNHLLFRCLYQQLLFRHIFATTASPTLAHRIDSYQNYSLIFRLLTPPHKLNTPFPLPHRWLWDMLDEFVNQFQSFCHYRPYVIRTEKHPGRLKFLQESWSVERVLYNLQSLIDKSSIIDILKQANDGVQLFPATDDLDHSGQSNVLKVMGYFSMVASLRVHCLLGNYLTGLGCLQPIDTSHQGFYTTLIDAHIRTIYHYGFANLMSHRYVEAIRSFNKFLAYMLDSDQLQQISLQPQYQQIPNKIEQMYALLAICLSLCPQDEPIDVNVNSLLMQKYGKKMSLMKRCNAESNPIYADLMAYVWPTYNTFFVPTSSDPRLLRSKESLLKDKDHLPDLYPKIFTPGVPLFLQPLVNNIQLEVVVEYMLKSRWKGNGASRSECLKSNFRKRKRLLGSR